MPDSPVSSSLEKSAAPVVIIGGGISGLACAMGLRHWRVPFLLVEQSPRFGGLLGTIEEQGYLVETGPQSFTLTFHLYHLIKNAGLEPELLLAPKRAPRYVYFGGKLVAAPMSPLSPFSTPLLDARAKWRLITEPLRHTHPPQGDESVSDFVRRKFSNALLENLVAPLISGVYAGDPEKLSLRAAFPKVHEWEVARGSIVRGAIKQARSTGTPKPPVRGLASFKHGIGSLPLAISAILGENAWHSSGASSISALSAAATSPARANPAAPRFELRVQRADGSIQTLQASAVIIALETLAASKLLVNLHPQISQTLATISSAPVAVVSTGYRLEAIPQDLNGFGFLVPRKEGLRILGSVWSSSLFPGRAPEGHVLLTTFMGGALDPEIVCWSEDRIAEAAHTDLAKVLGITESPVFRRVFRYQRALPQYNLGHAEKIAAIANLCSQTPGLFLAGNYLTGPSIGACVQHANQIAYDAATLVAPQSMPIP
jgi:protoporphyrinogen/coproporphyrinogen III oxidase